MKLAIIGSENTPIIDIVSYLENTPSEILAGGINGVDNCARDFAKDYKLPIREYLPNYDEYGNQAIFERNKYLIDLSDYVLFFWDGKSINTQLSIDYAQTNGKAIKIIPVRLMIPAGYRICIKHKLLSNVLALDMCKKIDNAVLKYSRIFWIENTYWYEKDDDFDIRKITADIFPLTDNLEKICNEIITLFGDEYCFVEVYYTSENALELAPKVNQPIVYKEVKRTKNLCDLLSNNSKLKISNSPILGGIVVHSTSKKTFEQIKTELQDVGFTNIQRHTVQQNLYKIDFETYKIDSKLLIESGWKNNVYMTNDIYIKYPNDSEVNRTKEWYNSEPNWKIIKHHQQDFYDYSGDDSSLDPIHW